MKKLLHLLLLTLFLCSFTNVKAKDVVFDFQNDCLTLFPNMGVNMNKNQSAYDFKKITTSAPVDGIRLIISPSKGKTPNRIWNTGTGKSRKTTLRLYGGTLTVSSESPISKITFQAQKWNNSNSSTPGTLTGKTWKGNPATSITIRIAGNSQINKITVSISGEVTPPKTKEVNSIAEFKALEKGTEAILNLKDAQVLYVHGNDMYIRDKSGAIDFYDSNLPYKAGDVLNGSVKGRRDVFNSMPELVSPTENKLTKTSGTATPVVVSVADMKGDRHVSDLVRIDNVSIDANAKKLSDGTQTIDLYDKFKTTITSQENCSVIAIGGVYNSVYQLYPVKITPTETRIKPETTATLDFNADYKKIFGLEEDIPSSGHKDLRELNGTSLNVNGVTLVNIQEGNENTRLLNSGGTVRLGAYKGARITIKSANPIKQILFDNTSVSYTQFPTTDWRFDTAANAWTVKEGKEVKEVTFSCSNSIELDQIKVIYWGGYFRLRNDDGSYIVVDDDSTLTTTRSYLDDAATIFRVDPDGNSFVTQGLPAYNKADMDGPEGQNDTWTYETAGCYEVHAGCEDNGYYFSTLYVDFPIDASRLPDDTYIYTIESGLRGAPGALFVDTVRQEGMIPAGTPMLIKSKQEKVNLFPSMDNGTAKETSSPVFKGSFMGIPKPAGGTIYTVWNASDDSAATGIGFYKYTGNYMARNKCYLQAGTSQAKIFLGFRDTTLGVKGTGTKEQKEHVVHDLQGRRVAHPGKGIYIVNHKKIVIK